MGRGNRERRPARRRSFKDPKPIVLIVTEGSVTEPDYLSGFIRAMKNPRVHIHVVGGVGVPKTIVEKAKGLKQNAERQARRESDVNIRYDEVWCVFDIDQHPNISEAKLTARDNGLLLAISNPCIELWLWLHFAEQPGMQHRHDLQRMMKNHVPNFDKHVDYSVYATGYEHAVRRAKRLDLDADSVNESGRNPTTGVWRLTESIRSKP